MSARRWSVAAALLLAACEGGGSDIGPRLQPVAEVRFRLQVLDEAGRGVAGAQVAIDGIAAAATGRSGRADLFDTPRNTRLCTVDGRSGSATDADQLPRLAFLAAFDGGPQLPYAVRLPDTGPSAGLDLATGVLASAAALDDTASSGALLQFAAGTAVSAAGAAAVRVRSGALDAAHLPGILPTNAGGTLLFSRGCWIDPPELASAPPAVLQLPNDLQLANGAGCELYRLDPDSGAWLSAGAGAVVDAGQHLRGAGVARGGLYAFAVPVAAAASVVGRVLDQGGRPVPYAQVQAATAAAQAGGDGRFRLDGLAASSGDGSPRTLRLEALGGALFYPSGTAVDVALQPGGIADAGDLVLATAPVANVRIQLVEHGRAYARERCVLSSEDGAMAAVTLFDDDGQAVIEDVPAGYYGFTVGHPSATQSDRVFEAQGVGFLQAGKLWQDLGAFLGETFWFNGSRNTRAQALDWRGGGPLRDVGIIGGQVPDQGFLQWTREGGVVIAGRDFGGRATASARTEAGGRTVTSAVSFVLPNAEHLQLPLRRALRSEVGAFDRHGRVRGELLQASASAEHRLRSTRRLAPSDWFDAVLLGEPIASSLPVELDPAAGGTAFAVGVAVPLGQLAAVEGSSSGGRFALQRVGLQRQLAVAEAATTALDLPLAHAAATTFTAAGAGQGLDAGFAAADLAFDLALLAADGTVADLVRGVGQNHALLGSDLEFTLPALQGDLAGDWLLAVGAERAAGGGAVAQKSVLQFGSAALSVPFLPLPDLLAPGDGATVAASGFRVDWTVPAGSSYLQLELVNADAGSDLHWLVVLPPTASSFEFVRLPPDIATPLVAGRSYRLTLSAFRVDRGPLLQRRDPYGDMSSYWLSIDGYKRGVRALSRRSIAITAN